MSYPNIVLCSELKLSSPRMASWNSYPRYQIHSPEQDFVSCRPGRGLHQDAANVDDNTESWIVVSPSSRVLGQQQQQQQRQTIYPWQDLEMQHETRLYHGCDPTMFYDETGFARDMYYAQTPYSVMPWKVEHPTCLDIAQCYPLIDPEALSSSSDSSYGDSPSPKYLHYSGSHFDGIFSLPNLGSSACGIDPCATIHALHRTCDDDADPVSGDLLKLDSKLASHPPASWSCGLNVIDSKSEEPPRQPLNYISPNFVPRGDSFSESISDSEYEPPSKVKQRNTARSHAIPKVTKLRNYKISKTKHSRQSDKISKALESGKYSTKSPFNTEEVKSRLFACPLWPYGCHANFPSKNEWKRHFNSQHLCLGFWRCDLCDDHEVNPNDFNRKDLFQQHLKRMHLDTSTKSVLLSRRNSKNAEPHTSGPTRTDSTSVTPVKLEEICSRCYVEVHAPPREMACIFCTDRFKGNDSSKAWLEHVGKHLSKRSKDGKQERDNATIDWEKDDTLRAWLLEVGVVVSDKDQEGSWQLAHTNVTAEIKARAFAKKLEGLRMNQDADGDKD